MGLLWWLRWVDLAAGLKLLWWLRWVDLSDARNLGLKVLHEWRRRLRHLRLLVVPLQAIDLRPSPPRAHELSTRRHIGGRYCLSRSLRLNVWRRRGKGATSRMHHDGCGSIMV